jgi:hypothetical protein
VPAAIDSESPLFVIGVARSGTTLLRWMLEEHPRIAIPEESHWIVDLADCRDSWTPQRQEQVLTEVLTNPKYRRWWMSEHEVRVAVCDRAPPSYSALVAAVFGVYARRQGKPRWGDKTPWYAMHIDLLDELFPEAVFVHIVRDGREVAASLAEVGDRDPIEAAQYWRKVVSRARDAGTRLGAARFCHIRLEDLIAEPEKTLRRVCAVVGETYTPGMLDYPQRAIGTFKYLEPKYRRTHRHLDKPPTPGLRDWRAGLSRSDCDKVEVVCGPLLEQLGYSVSSELR